MIQTKFVEDADNYAADLVPVAAGRPNRLDEQVQRPFGFAFVERLESRSQIGCPRPLQPDPGSQAFGREASANVAKDLQGFLFLASAVEDSGQLDGSIRMPRLELKGCAKRLLIAILSQQFRL